MSKALPNFIMSPRFVAEILPDMNAFSGRSLPTMMSE